MRTPICDFVKEYAHRDALRLHMPGHKGTPLTGAEPWDITEIDGADVLYHETGIIRESEENAAALFGSGRTLYSTEGSSLSIRAMLYLAALWAKKNGRPARILAARNAHRVFVTAAALLDLDVTWLYGEGELLRCTVTPKTLATALRSEKEKPAAVYVTSPDYLGNVADIRGLAEVCHEHGVLLLVDNAHGAYLRFLPEDRHPLALGADLCCDSAHKTLPVLTGGGYLHISQNAPALAADMAQNAMALFASTSPSYLILQSLDRANRYLADGYRERLASFAARVTDMKARLAARGYLLCGDEPMKLTIAAKPFGYRGDALSDLLRGQGIECEFADPDYAVFMMTPETGADGLARLESALLGVPRGEAIPEKMPVLPRPVRVCSPREALLAPSRTCEISACVGKVLADPAVSCPPAVPIAVCGERIDEQTAACFRYYGMSHATVMED